VNNYPNLDTCKAQILSDNTNKSGIYMFTNKIDGKRYIGSSNNLRVRFLQYLNTNYLLSNTSMYICNALFKHGYSNFSLIIFEYCSVSDLLIREKHYWDIFKPEYNIAQDPTAPMLGRTPSDKTRKKISDTKKGQAKTEGSGSPSQAIEVSDIINNTTTTYNSMSEAARVLNINLSVIVMYFSRNQKKKKKKKNIKI